MLENKNKILSVYPEMASAFTKAEAAMATPGCSGCRKNRIYKELADKLNAIKTEYPDREQLDLAITQPVRATRTKHEPFLKMPVHRKGCVDCVIKHLSNAYALNSEAVNGYPEHADKAAAEVELAFSQAEGTAKIKLYNTVAAYSTYRRDQSIAALSKAHRLIKEVLDSLTTEQHYKLIGLLNQAEEECWEVNQKLANSIRAERLKVMANKAYKPNILALLRGTTL